METVELADIIKEVTRMQTEALADRETCRRSGKLFHEGHARGRAVACTIILDMLNKPLELDPSPTPS